MEQKSVSLRLLFSKFSFTTHLTLEVPQAEGRLIYGIPYRRICVTFSLFPIFTEERKLEVPPRETLRMSDTFRYIYDTTSVYIANRRRARASSGIWRILRFRFLPPEIDLNALLCGHLYR